MSKYAATSFDVTASSAMSPSEASPTSGTSKLGPGENLSSRSSDGSVSDRPRPRDRVLAERELRIVRRFES